MRSGGREQSILDILKEMEATLLLEKKPEKNRQKPKGKHSGSRNLLRENPLEIQMSDIDLAATIRANIRHFSAGYLPENTIEETSGEKNKENQPLELRLKRYRRKCQTSILFVVDASRSQGNKERLAFVKGAVQAILQQVYTERNKVGVVVFGNRQAQEVLPFTKSVDFASKQMEQLTAKGNTPLGEGIRLAVRTMEQERQKYPENLQLMVLLTDGKCNYDTREGQTFKLALEAAKELKRKQLPVLVVDTENSVFGMGLAKKIARAAGGRYVELL